jgi:YggT family protein
MISMLNNAILFLLKTLLDLLTIAFLLRFYFQLTKVSFQTQAAQLIVSLTNFAVKPTRRIVPSIGSLDLSTLLLAFSTQVVLSLLSFWLKGFPFLIVGSQIWLVMLGIAALSIASMSLTIFLYAVLIQAILSWVNPYTPIAPVLSNLTNPVLNWLRRYIPTAGNVDLTPLVFIIAAQLLHITILIPLENNLLAMI